jgi:hypothetical protein
MQAQWLTAILHREEEVVVAACPEVGTVEEALANLREATELFLGEIRPSRLAERQQGAGARTLAVRMGRSLTRREDWPRDAVGVRWPGGDTPQWPRYGCPPSPPVLPGSCILVRRAERRLG